MPRSFRCSFCGIDSTNAYANTLAILTTPALEQLLHSNVPPAHGTKTSVKAQLARVQGRIEMLDEAIKNLQQARSLLEQEETNLTSVMSPIRCIPLEILMEIFTLYAEDWWERLCGWQLRGALSEEEYMGWDDFEGVDEWDDWMDEEARNKKSDQDLTELTLRPTNVLSQVCHSWRAAARSCSSLWSNIYLHGNYRLPAAQKLLKTQLCLSANRPLRVHVSYRFFYNDSLFPLLRDILPTSRRWTSVDMVIGDPDHPVFPRSTISPPFPSLVSLSLILGRPGGFDRLIDDTPFVYKITAADAPLLREVSLSWPDNTAATVDLPWAQLHKLRFWGQSGDSRDLLSIISSLRELVELDILGIDGDDRALDSRPFRSLQLPSLRCLRLSNVGCRENGTPGMLLPYLQVPSLRTLYWTGMKHSEMERLYTMCAPRIDPDGTPDTGQRVLRHLHLYNPARDVLEAQGFNPGESWDTLLDAIGPQLESFKIEYPTSSGADVSLILDVLVDRITAGNLPFFHACMLQGVHVNSCSLADLMVFVESHKCDIRVRNCTFDTQEELDDAFMRKLQESFPKSIPDGAFFELDVEAPNRKRLFYTSKFGTRLEDSCDCRTKGLSLRRDNRSSVLRVV